MRVQAPLGAFLMLPGESGAFVRIRTAERCLRASRVQRSYDCKELEKAGRIPAPGNEYQGWWNKILPKHVDFVVCNEHFKPVCAIEIDGKSHNSKDRIDRDDLVDYIFKGINLPLERVRVGSDFRLITKELAEALKQ